MTCQSLRYFVYIWLGVLNNVNDLCALVFSNVCDVISLQVLIYLCTLISRTWQWVWFCWLCRCWLCVPVSFSSSNCWTPCWRVRWPSSSKRCSTQVSQHKTDYIIIIYDKIMHTTNSNFKNEGMNVQSKTLIRPTQISSLSHSCGCNVWKRVSVYPVIW